jgi:hypothetical protein
VQHEHVVHVEAPEGGYDKASSSEVALTVRQIIKARRFGADHSRDRLGRAGRARRRDLPTRAAIRCSSGKEFRFDSHRRLRRTCAQPSRLRQEPRSCRQASVPRTVERLPARTRAYVGSVEHLGHGPVPGWCRLRKRSTRHSRFSLHLGMRVEESCGHGRARTERMLSGRASRQPARARWRRGG